MKQFKLQPKQNVTEDLQEKGFMVMKGKENGQYVLEIVK